MDATPAPARPDDRERAVRHVLFLCTHNSARSILAEGLLNARGRGAFRGHKDWSECARPGAPAMDLVITVCDSAAGEACPLWPGQPVTAHWGVPDPSRVAGTEEQQRRAYRDVAATLERRVGLMLALPMASLERLALQQRLRDLGTR